MDSTSKSTEKILTISPKIPEKSRPIPTNKYQPDEFGFVHSPNGSFWDMDGEYFNRFGFDVHGGHYADGVDYIPGSGWIPELGCYECDKEKYLQEDKFNFEDGESDDGCANFEGDLGGTFPAVKKEKVEEKDNKFDSFSGISGENKGKKTEKIEKFEELNDEWEEVEDE